MKHYFRSLATCLMPLLITSIVSAQDEAGVIYKQKITREDVPIRQALRGSRGVIYLTNDSVVFKARKQSNREIDFRIAYHQIKSVKRVNPLFFPNRISIKLEENKKYRLYTYRRKQLIERIRNKLIGQR